MQVHRFANCRPEPLASYLKALGVLRVIAEQVDPSARGWWECDHFCLATVLSANDLQSFFLQHYSPTPIISPWNGGSGFYPADQKAGIDAIATSTHARFSDYREAIAAGRALTAGLTKSPKERPKEEMLRRCRSMWRGRLLRWLDTAIVIRADGSLAYPALLGTAGGDGRLDFTNNFMQRLTELFEVGAPEAPPRPESSELLSNAFFGTPTRHLKSVAIGMFLPGAAGGANAASGFSGDSLVNPWDFVLALEGTLLFQSGVSRRARAQEMPRAAAPFAVHPAASGYASAALGEDAARGEQWMPLWESPASLSALEALFREGRADIGSKPAERAVDIARAVTRLGVSRGLTAFSRFAFLERNGQANLAIPLGTLKVQPQPHSHLLDEVAPWIDRLSRVARQDGAPAGFARLAQVCESGVIDCCRPGNDPARWQALLAAIGEAEAAIPRSPRFAAEKRLRPLPQLSSAWIDATDDGTPEHRLACAFAAQRARLSSREFSIRRYFLPLNGRAFASTAERLTSDASVVCTAGDFATDALRLILRVVTEASQAGDATFPLAVHAGQGANLSDIEEFITGGTDDYRIRLLARPLMAVASWDLTLPGPPHRIRPLAPYALVRLAHAPESFLQRANDSVRIPLNPNIVLRLSAGDLRGAVAAAARRLAASGARPRGDDAVGAAHVARRLLASLAFPISRATYSYLFNVVIAPSADADVTALGSHAT